MDILFGTYHCPDHEPEQFGLVEAMPRGYVAQLVHPFRFRKTSMDTGVKSIGEPHHSRELVGVASTVEVHQ